MKIRISTAEIVLLLSLGLLLLQLGGMELVNTLRMDRIRSQMIASYKGAVSKNELPRPSSNPDSVIAGGHHPWSFPAIVMVKTISGQTFFYHPVRVPNSFTLWRFEWR